MRVFLTGATGYLGSAVAEACVRPATRRSEWLVPMSTSANLRPSAARRSPAICARDHASVATAKMKIRKRGVYTGSFQVMNNTIGP